MSAALPPPGTERRKARLRTAGALALLLLLPAALLWPSLVGVEVFLPFSPATFPPFAAELPSGLRADLEAHGNMAVTEVPITFVPELQFVRDELAAGRLPHWNPYARFGAALLATSVVGLLYPPNWLTFLALEPVRGLALNAWLALAIAGVLMFGFLRARRLSSGAALFGAVAFAWSATLSANLHFYQRVHALVWLPGMWWALAVMADAGGARRRRAGAGLAACVAMSWLAGFPAYAAAATLAAGAYGAWLAAAHARARGARAGLAFAGCAVACAGLGGALAAVQLLPMFAFFPESNRDPDPSRDVIAAQAFDPMGFAGYVLPDPFGTPARPPRVVEEGAEPPDDLGPPPDYSMFAWMLFSRRSWDSGAMLQPNFNYVEYAVYPGALVVLFALAALLGRGPPWRWLFVVVLVVLWVLACGGRSTAWLNTLPLVRSVPPMRFVGPGCALLAALAALGATRDRLTRGRAWVVAGFAFALALACVAGALVLGGKSAADWLASATPDLVERYRSRFPFVSPELVRTVLGPYALGSWMVLRDNLHYGAAAFALGGAWFVAWALLGARPRAARVLFGLALAGTAGELFALALPLNRGRPDVALSAPALDLLRAERAEHAAHGGFAVVRGAAGPDVPPTALPPCLLVPERIRDLHAYTFVDARSHRLFVALWGPDHMLRAYWPKAFPDDERLRRPLFDLLGVRYVLSTEPLAHAGEEVPPPRAQHGEFHVYERPSAFPRAFVVPEVRTCADEDGVIAAMIAPDLEPGRTVLATPEQAAALAGHRGAPGAEARTAEFLVDTPTEQVLRVSAGPAGFLVVSDALMSGWTATIDGTEVPITRGNLFMRVVPIGAEACEVRFSYRTPRLTLGLVVTALALAGVGWLAFGRRQTAGQEEEPAA